MLPALNRAMLARNGSRVHHAMGPDGPINILQIGDGNFLRGFVDWMIDEANEQGQLQGRVAVAQPLSRGIADKINAQDGLYTVLLRGIENGQSVERRRVISCVKTGLNPYAEWDKMLALATSADLRFVISNTTEAGIADVEEAYTPSEAQQSFPAKIAALLYARYTALKGDKRAGLVFLPCELIEANGSKLKSIVLQHAQRWNLDAGFAAWVESANVFCNTLVDRIVPGYPGAEAEALFAKFGYINMSSVIKPFIHLRTIRPFISHSISGKHTQNCHKHCLPYTF